MKLYLYAPKKYMIYTSLLAILASTPTYASSGYQYEMDYKNNHITISEQVEQAMACNEEYWGYQKLAASQWTREQKISYFSSFAKDTLQDILLRSRIMDKLEEIIQDDSSFNNLIHQTASSIIQSSFENLLCPQKDNDAAWVSIIEHFYLVDRALYSTRKRGLVTEGEASSCLVDFLKNTQKL